MSTTTGAGTWWEQMPKARIVCTYSRKGGNQILWVSPEGLSWGPAWPRHFRCRWEEVEGLGVADHDFVLKGGGWAFGFGPIGLALVAATALANSQAGKVVDRRIIEVHVAGRSHTFATNRSLEDVTKLLQPALDHFGAVGQTAAGSSVINQRSGSAPPAGWYPDPSSPGTTRWWDGTAWGPAAPPTPPPPPPPPPPTTPH